MRLSHREHVIVSRRFSGDTLDAIGFDLYLSRERVRQLEARALERLRAAAGRA